MAEGKHILYIGVALGVIYMLIARWFLGHRRRIAVPRAGIDPGFLGIHLSAAKEEFRLRGHELVDEGYHRYKGSNFLVQTSDMERLVVSPKLLPEIRMLPETKLRHSIALVEKHLGYYSGLDVLTRGREAADVCRIQLNQNLSTFLPLMQEELETAITERLRPADNAPAGFLAYDLIYSMVLSITSRVFVGQPLCRDPAWLNVMAAYLAGIFSTAAALRPYPRFLRPFLRQFLAPKRSYDKILANAEQVLTSAINERWENSSQHVDLLGFLAQAQKGGDPATIALQLLVLGSASLHNSTMAAVHALYELCCRPECIDDLRREIRSARHGNDTVWSLETIKSLKKLDSFLKESTRVNQPDALGLNRIATSTVKLSDGTEIPLGTFLNLPAIAMAKDPAFYDNANQFRADRFYSVKAGDKSIHSKNEFTDIEPGNVFFGNGRLTCPGRWYASAMIKLILGNLLEKYDFRFPDGQSTRPPNLYNDGVMTPNPKQVVMFRRREERGVGDY